MITKISSWLFCYPPNDYKGEKDLALHGMTWGAIFALLLIGFVKAVT